MDKHYKFSTGKDFSVKHFQSFGTKGYRLDKTSNKGKFKKKSFQRRIQI
jgi:hypothetical protein